MLATPYDANREIVKLQDVAPIMRKAQIAIEDSRFYEHGGIDVRGTARALATNVAGGGVSQGGSSITQQYVKLMLLEKALRDGDKQAANDAIAVSYSRKLQELKYALDVEKTMSKNQILEGTSTSPTTVTLPTASRPRASTISPFRPRTWTWRGPPPSPVWCRTPARPTRATTPSARRSVETSSSTGCWSWG